MTRKVTFGTALVLLMALVMVTSPMAMAASVGVAGGATTEDVSVDEVQTQATEEVAVASELEEEVADEDVVEVFVRMDAEESDFFAQQTGGMTPTSDSQSALEFEAEVTQAQLEKQAELTEGMEIVTEFWITNAVLVEVDTNQVDLERLKEVDGVTELHPNYEVELVEPEIVESPAVDEPVTYGLDQINAPQVWDEFDNKGDGVTAAVIDTGINADHELFENYDEENWAAFDFDGTERTVDPYDDNGHGTHVAGTVLGGQADAFGGTHVGVAPEAELLAINVFPDPAGATSLAAIVAGMERAVEEDADVANLSLGGSGYAGIYIDVIKNAKEAGTHIVSSSGNSGVGSEGTPANVYNATAVGATTADEDVVWFSTGTEVDTAEEWGYLAPDSWPDEYETPDVSAPGVGVISAYAGDEDAYASLQGTSMAAPHTTGLVALLMSEYDTNPSEVKNVLEETATKPDEPGPEAQFDAMLYDMEYDSNQFDRLYDDDVRDVRYGYGIIDAYAASLYYEESGTIEGVVVDDGEPVEGVEVMVNSSVDPVTTDEDGAFSMDLPVGTYNVTAYDFGLLAIEDEVEVVEDETVDLGTLTAFDIVDAMVVEDQPAELAAGDEFTVEIEVANVEYYEYDFEQEFEDYLVVELDGEEIDPQDRINVTDDDEAIDGTVSIDVAVDSDAPEDELYMIHRFFNEELGMDHDVITGPTDVLPEDAESDDVQVALFDPPEEAMYGDADVIWAMFENPGDFTETETVFLYLDDEGGTTVPVDVEIAPGETEIVNFAFFGWYSDLRGDAVPGDLDMQVSVGEPPTLEDESNEPVDESPVETITVYAGSSVSGTVTDADTAEPMIGADVVAFDENGDAVAATETDTDGEYDLIGLKPGEYEVLTFAPGWALDETTIEIEADLDAKTNDVTLGSLPAFVYEMDEGQTYSIGLPGPIQGGTVGDVVHEDTEGVIWAYDATDGQWTMASPDDEVEPLDALVVVADEDAEAVIEFAGQPGEDLGSGPTSHEVEQGWNFVTPSIHADVDDAFIGTGDLGAVMSFKDEADSVMIPDGGFEGVQTLDASDHVTPFAGYFVFVEDKDTELASTIYDGITRDSAYANLGIDADRTEGTVTSAVSGDPIDGATILVEDIDFETQTAEDGSYVIPAMPAGEALDITVEAEGFVGNESAVEPGQHDVELQDEVYFEVTSLDVDETELEAGEEFTVTYTVENKGVESATQQVDVAFGMDVENPRGDDDTYTVNTSSIELDADEDETVVITEEVGDFQPTGDQQIGVVTFDDVTTENVTVLQQPTYEVSDLDLSEIEIEQGDQIDVSATIENVGDLDGEKDVELRLDDETLATEEGVVLQAGETTTVEFETVEIDEEPGEYDVTVWTEDDEAAGTLTVLEDANYSVSDLDVDETEIEQGDEINVSAVIENVGDLDGEKDVELRLDGEEVETIAALELNASESETIAFENVTVDEEPGEYDVTVWTEDDYANETITVTESD